MLTRQQQEQAALNNYNFDHPDAFDFDLIVSTLQKLKQGKSVKVPVYDFTTHSRKKDWVGLAGWAVRAPGRRQDGPSSGTFPLQKTLYGANVIIFEGIMAFADKTLLEVRVGLQDHPFPAPPAPPTRRTCFKCLLRTGPVTHPVPMACGHLSHPVVQSQGVR